MIRESAIYPILLVTFIGGLSEPMKLYITEHYLLLVGIQPLDNTPHNWLYDVRNEKFYTLRRGVVECHAFEPYRFGEPRGWSSLGYELIARTKIADTTYLNCDCVVLREEYLAPDLFNPGQKRTSHSYKVMCKVPEIERLPLQTRLGIPWYKEWVSEEYPLLVKEWHDAGEGSPSQETRVIEMAPFPAAEVKEWFGVDIGESAPK